MAITRITETHAEASDYEVILVASTTNPQRSNTRANTGAYSWRFTTNNGYFALPLDDETAIRTSLFIYMDVTPTSDISLIRVKESYTALMAVEVRIMEDEQTLRLYIDEVQQDEVTWASVGFVPATWIRISLTASVTSNYASVYLNDSNIMTYSGAIANTPWDSVRYGQSLGVGGMGAFTYIDDVYVDSMGADADALPPSYGFTPSYAEGLGDHNDWVAIGGALKNAEMVDDGAVDDGDATYNFVGAVGGNPKDSFETTDIALAANFIISAAIPWCVVKKLNAADDAQIILTATDGVPPVKQGAAQDTPLTYGYRRSRFTTQPDGSSWNLTDFNSMQFGYLVGGVW
jgi:hypothetical protein